MKLRVFTEPQQGASYATQASLAKHAEELGFDAYFRSDHFLTMGGDGLPGPTDSWLTLAALAVETSTIRLGTLVSSATFRLPGPLAIAVAQVDQMSGGRVELGLGTGWFEAEHAAYGIPFPPVGERFDILEEQLAIITGLWRATSPFSYQGKHYQVSGSPGLPKPVAPSGPPVIVGGFGRKRTPALAARFADEYNVAFRPFEAVGLAFDRLREASAALGRDKPPILSVAQTVCCGRDDAEVTRRAAAIGRDVDELKAHGAAGTPDQVIAGLTAYRELGAERLYLQVLDMTDLAHLDLIAAEVLPHV